MVRVKELAHNMESSAPRYLVELRLRKAQARLRRWLPHSLAVFLSLELLVALGADGGPACAVGMAAYAWVAWVGYRQWAASTAIADLHRPGVNQEVFASPLRPAQAVDAVYLAML